MRKQVLGITLPICGAILIAGAFLASAGDLNPPPGPIGPTMMALDQVEARTPVQSLAGDLGWLHIINQPGSYYLTGNLVGQAGKSGIRIDVDDVTLDLNGFAVIGTGPTAGTVIFSAADNVVIGNGSLRGWAQGVALEGDYCRLLNLRISGNLFDGVELLGKGCTIRGCTIADNGSNGIQLAFAGGGARVAGCTIRNNNDRQILVQSDGNTLEHNSLAVEAGQSTFSAIAIFGSANVVSMSGIILDEPGLFAIEVSGDGNQIGDSTIRLGPGATGAAGIVVTGFANEIVGGHITVAATGATALRLDQPANINGVLIGLLAGADGSTGILANANGYIAHEKLFIHADNAVGIDVQGGAANVGTTIYEAQMRVTGAGSTAIRVGATASVIQMSGIVMDGDNGTAITVLGSSGGHSIVGNHMVLAGASVSGPILNGTADLVKGNDILVLGDNSIAINQFSGTTGMISDNLIRLDALNAIGILVPDFVNDLLTNNIVIGAGTRFDIGEGNQQALIVSNPGTGFVQEDVVNLSIGP